MINAAFILDREHFEGIYGAECLAMVSQHAHVFGPTPVTAEELLSSPPPWLGEVDVLFAGWGSPKLDAALLAQMPRLRAVFYGAGTVRPIASDALWERGIVVTSAAALNAVPVVEYTLGAILLSFKRAWHHDRAARDQRTYEPLRALPIPTGAGAVVGLVSLGLIGTQVAERLRAYDVHVLAYDPEVDDARARRLGIEHVSLEELFAGADIVSLHTPLLPQTRQLVGRSLLERMKPCSTLINTARGGLINEPELIAFLQQRVDVQAILDVTDPEPPVASSPLYALPNVFLTPHIAGSIGAECRRMGRATVDDFLRYVRGEPLQQVVRRDEFVRRA